MKNIFSNFFRIDLGHIGVMISFLVGLGIGWRDLGAKIETVWASEQSHYGQAMAADKAAAESARIEHRAIDRRVEALEQSQRANQKLAEQVAALTAITTSLRDTVAELKSDMRETQRHAESNR